MCSPLNCLKTDLFTFWRPLFNHYFGIMRYNYVDFIKSCKCFTFSMMKLWQTEKKWFDCKYTLCFAVIQFIVYSVFCFWHRCMLEKQYIFSWDFFSNQRLKKILCMMEWKTCQSKHERIKLTYKGVQIRNHCIERIYTLPSYPCSKALLIIISSNYLQVLLKIRWNNLIGQQANIYRMF